MSEAVSEAVLDQGAISASTRPRPFGTTVDPREAGRKGGVSSGRARRLRPLSKLEAKILESRNGAAQAKLLEIKRAEARALLDEEMARDKALLEIDEQILDAREQLDEAYAELRQVELDLERAKSDDDALAAYLRDVVGEARVERVVTKLGWVVDE